MPPPAGCPISWQPHALAPVFFGARSLTPDDGAPVPLRLFFPSLDGAVESAPLLQGCGRYPLVVLCHGHCIGDTDHYRRWFRLPAQLARSGCVVVVPHLAGVAGGSHPSAADHPDLATLAAVVSWARAEWEHADVLLPAPATAVVGHSFGALIGARFAALGGVSAFAGLSGVWQDWPMRPLPVEELTMPMLLFWGDSELFTQVPDSIWDGLSRPRHRVVYAGGEHWDYLPDGDLACRGLAGPCPHVAAATGDLVTMFLGKYLPPEHADELFDAIPHSLAPPELRLTPEQEFFAGAYLGGYEALLGNDDCGAAVDAVMPPLVANRHTRETHSLDEPCSWVRLLGRDSRVLTTTRPPGYRWCDHCFPERADG